MSLLYYNAIFKSEGKATAVYNAAYPNFNMFKEYLDIAIQTQKGKRVSVAWEEAEEAIVSKSRCLVSSFKYELNTTIEFKIPNNIYLLEFQQKDINILEINTITIVTPKEPINLELSKSQFIRLEDNNYYISIEEKLSENIMYTILNGGTVINLTPIRFNNIIIEDINQKDNSEFIPISLDMRNDVIKLTFKGDFNSSKSLMIRGFEIKDYYFLDQKTYSDITYKNGQKINIIMREINNIICSDEINEKTELYMNGIMIKHKVIPIKKPASIIYKNQWYQLSNNGKDIKISYNSTLELDKPLKVRDENNIDFEIVISKNRRNMDSILIRLIDDENDDDDMVTSFSKIDYFFEDGVTSVDNGKPRNRGSLYKEFKVKRKNREENTIELESAQWNQRIKIEDLPTKIFLPINTYQLEKQRSAVQNIRFKPLLEHKGLISLVERKEENNAWSKFNYGNVEQWHILTDETRDGTLAQREFVRGAISTPDFMLLEGPPGSGKTTAIVELIVQLIQRKKRILLAASTHVAIDNVLERLKDSEGNLFKGILPIRIGDSNNVSRGAKDYTVKNVIDDNNKRFESIILESANLVCGTTIGILQHPLFRKEEDEPINPEFDYLIIDESSKTTFQEFLVPALYAKKWILVGDIKQLSPFTDRDHIIANLSDFTIYNNGKSETVFRTYEQSASLLLFKFLEKEKLEQDSKNYMLIKVQQEVLKSTVMELRARIKNNIGRYREKSKYIGFITDSNLEVYNLEEDNFFIITREDIINGNPNAWIMAGLSLIFIDATIYDHVNKYIPANKVHLGIKDWGESEEFFKANAYYETSSKNIEVREKNRALNSVKDIVKNTNEFLQSKTWASEVAWRIIRKYDLRLSDTNLNNHDRDVELLVPTINREAVISKIDIVHSIALPSALESLQRGVPTKREFRFSSVLNSGFNEVDKKSRHIVLDYQHRMHDEISKFPRSEFYDGKALKNSSKVLSERQWEYSRYPARNIWVDVNGNTNKNYNVDEVRVLINELKQFVNWAKETNKKWTVACLTFYKGQERKIKEELRVYCNQKNRNQNFEIYNVEIALYTIDKFQGREADITFISMVQTFRVGFLDSPNRLNVALTRARYQRVIIGKKSYFTNQNWSEELKRLALNEVVFNEEVKR